MTADLQLQQVIITAPGEKHQQVPTSPFKDVPNPQQGMADPAASVSAATVATATNTASCSSPLTVTSLEAAAAAGTAAANKANGVPQVVSSHGIVPVPELDSLSAPMANLGLYHMQPPPLMEEKKMCIRTPPTEHDNRKLFVGGLPTDVTDHAFLEFFQQFGEVIDSVVMVDRVTKRSRGFGFVTFASENDANSILTAIPCKTGYVIINGKQCEVKASTPKADDGQANKHGHHHGIPGMWKSNPPHHDNHGYSPRRSNNGPPGPMKQMVHHHYHQPRGEKLFNTDNELNGDADGRNFDELYVQQSQMTASYQAMNAYGSNFTTSETSMYQQNYRHAYPAASPYGYAYTNSSAAPVPSSREASYPAPSQGYAQYPSNTMPGNNGYYDPYAQQYPYQYASQYGNDSMHPSTMMGQMGYADSNVYYAEGEGDLMPDQGVNASDGGFEQYPQSYPGDGDYDQAATADQYE
mmetsp:Transcript_17901/g.38697  ORF Transcript_17901/g.38697 Transcript_17901/m.38697 type:complete len:466 (+) Transcript_17901:163-1560(+)|eukprot:CAMPEP_0172309614 /NCGR_PEP_ID=MMETSP1058-20130122/10259_1 /TAXON_ID=83371 /ORGANISM="Detonula confervacea, Strain CCMP 353" /LENGTH=465 /DNA_ID=CAMNT_0013022273 /DNA_START=165 /DNA_END=1562 /DNA_ORIENTATION=-